MRWKTIPRNNVPIFLVCSTERYIIITTNDISPPPTVIPPTTPLHPNLTWPTASGINETEARRICQTPILQSPIFSLCSNYTAQALTVITDSCMLDLLVGMWNISRFSFYCSTAITNCQHYLETGKNERFTVVLKKRRKLDPNLVCTVFLTAFLNILSSFNDYWAWTPFIVCSCWTLLIW